MGKEPCWGRGLIIKQLGNLFLNCSLSFSCLRCWQGQFPKHSGNAKEDKEEIQNLECWWGCFCRPGPQKSRGGMLLPWVSFGSKETTLLLAGWLERTAEVLGTEWLGKSQAASPAASPSTARAWPARTNNLPCFSHLWYLPSRRASHTDPPDSLLYSIPWCRRPPAQEWQGPVGIGTCGGMDVQSWADTSWAI